MFAAVDDVAGEAAQAERELAGEIEEARLRRSGRGRG